MVTSLNSARTARDAQEQQVLFLRFTANYNDNSMASGVVKGVLPQGAIIIGTDVYTNTSYNANSTNVFTVGSNSTQLDNIVPDAAFAESTQGAIFYDIKPTGTALGPLAADTTVQVKYTQTGPTAATQGQTTVVIKYITALGTTGSATADN